MEPIGSYQHLCEGVTIGDFLADDPPAFLLHHAAMSALNPLGSTPGSTRNRLFLVDDRAPYVPGAIARSEAFSVLPLLSKSGRSGGRLVIGCGATCDIYLDDSSLSREHAWIERRGDDYFLGDETSMAGTKVNGVDLQRGYERQLRTGDTIAFGKVELMFLGPVEFFNFVQRFLG